MCFLLRGCRLSEWDFTWISQETDSEYAWTLIVGFTKNISPCSVSTQVCRTMELHTISRLVDCAEADYMMTTMWEACKSWQFDQLCQLNNALQSEK